MSLRNSEIERYSRQIILKDIGINGQKKLKKSKVLMIKYWTNEQSNLITGTLPFSSDVG